MRADLLNGMSPEAFWTDHLENYIAKQKIYEREEETHAHFMDKADIEQAQAFEHLEKVKPTLANAFLFNKRFH